MEYDFTRSHLDTPEAHFSMDHEAFGTWLTEEVGEKVATIREIEAALAALQRNETWDYLLSGHEYDLHLSRSEANVRAHALDLAFDAPDDDALQLYDTESAASCGLEDFIGMFEDWVSYVGLNCR